MTDGVRGEAGEGPLYDAGDTGQRGGAIPVAHWRSNRQRRATRSSNTVSIRRLGDTLLVFMAALAIIRGSQIWYGYPTEQNDFIPGGNSRDSIMLYLLLACSIGYVAMFTREVLQRVVSSSFVLKIFYAFVVVSIVFSVQPASSGQAVFGVLALSAPILLFRWRFGEAGALAIFRRLMIGFLLVNLAYTIAAPHFAFMSGSLAGDMRGMFPHKNGFGHAMSYIAILMLPTINRQSIRDPWTLAFAGATGLAVVFALLAHSSTAILQIAIGIVALMAIKFVRRIEPGLSRTLAMTAAYLSLFALIFIAGAGGLELIVESFGKDMTFSGRSYIWAALIPHIFDYPMTGHGFGMFRDPKYIDPFLKSVPFAIHSTHNTYIELALNIGIPGVISWVLFMLGRLSAKMMVDSGTAAARSASARSAAVLIMILIGSGTEASQMLSTRFALVFLMLALPLDRIAARDVSSSRRTGDTPNRAG